MKLNLALSKFLSLIMLCGFCQGLCSVSAQDLSFAGAQDLNVAKKGTASPIDSVNPFIGTSAHGHTYPGATLPFGMVQLSPDTFDKGWDWCSGYHWSDNSIMGFSHTHLSGTGCGDLGDVLFAPTTGKINLMPGTREEPEKGYRSRFSHADEKASPGFYSVLLKTYDIKAELTATKHVGFHRYSFPRTEQANIVIDLSHGIEDKPIALDMNVVGDHTVTGMRRSKGWAKDQYVYFAAEFSKPFTSFGTTSDETKPNIGERHVQGTNAKGWVTFNTSDGAPVMVKVALSTTSVDGAMRNLAAETPGWDFDQTHQDARNEWSKILDKIKVTDTAQKKERETFYTALYHTMLAPTLISDVDGQFRGSDTAVHKADNFECYSTFSLWDTFRAEHALLAILQPERVVDMLKSFEAQAQYHKDKTLPIWPLFASETYCMIGYPSFPVIAEAEAKGIAYKDYPHLLDMMLENDKRNDWWAEKGYIPADKEKESVSKTLEFAYDDFALAQLARKLGKDDVYKKYIKRAESYKNVYDKQSGFMRGRLADGSWRQPFDPALVTEPTKLRDFTEANAWQYTWFVPHDVAGLINLMGGRQAFVKKLDALFDENGIKQETNDLDVSGLIGQYAHGNEPSHHVAYLYSYAGAPDKTADHVRQIREQLYDNTPEGLCGNEDCGQMSAWYVFSALGFYPVDPVSGEYVFGVPGFREAEISMPGGKKLTITANDLSPKNYISKVTLGGAELKDVHLSHDKLINGGQLEFVLSDKASANWGTKPDVVPPSMSSQSP